jgi:Holliday junction resolvase RusA-like endonuclease
VIVLNIPGVPVADARPRFWKGRTLTPKRQRHEAARIKKLAKEAMGSQSPLEGPLQLAIEFTYPWPASASKARRTAPGGSYRPSRPDLDNLIKLQCDALNAIIWLDDAQIVEVHASKRFGEVPGVSIIVETLGEGNAAKPANSEGICGDRGNSA